MITESENVQQNMQNKKAKTDKTIHLFNACWEQWVKCLQKQMPALTEDFETTLNAIYLVKKDMDQPMFLFQQYTAPNLDQLVRRNTDFFHEMAINSGRAAIPLNFQASFEKLPVDQQKSIWATLDSLVMLVCSVYPEYNATLEASKSRWEIQQVEDKINKAN